MAIVESTSEVTHKYLMNKSKWDLASMYMRLLEQYNQQEQQIANLKSILQRHI